MEKSSYFIENRALFGSFPTQDSINELQKEGVKFFVNLTNACEKKITPYKTKYTYISYPIKDRYIPVDKKKFAIFILKVSCIIKNLNKGELLYVHCKGGHGRSGIVVAILLCYIFNLKPKDALEYTKMFHKKRKTMREKWRQIGSPQTFEQKSFVHNFCKPIYFYKHNNKSGFSNFTKHEIFIKDLGTFPTSEAAFQSYKCLDDKDYIQKQKESKSPLYSKKLGNTIIVKKNWVDVRLGIMYQILKLKFDQHEDLKKKLLNTGVSNIIYKNRIENFWGTGKYNNGDNCLGKQLEKLREYYYKND
jgi:ribA/ribD-fused uncharacterized protein